MPSLKKLVTDKNVVLLMIVFSLIMGIFNTLGTVIGEFAPIYDFSTVNYLF